MSLPPVKLWFVVPAAGIGSRMQSQTPKQYLHLHYKTILEHTLERLLQLSEISGLVVVHSKSDDVITSLPFVKNEKVTLVEGGAERCHSVLHGLMSLEGRASSNDWVLVHAAARPCVALKDIRKLIAVLSDDRVGGILAVGISDTIKRARNDTDNNRATILETLDRTVLWQAQTPQMFRFGLLQQSLQQALDKELPITDEASALELAGYDVKIIAGSSTNLKITRPEDLAIAKLILKQQSNIDEEVGR